MSTESIIREHVIWSCAAGAVPVPLVDLAAVTAIQLDMLKQLSAEFDVPYSEEQGKSWLTALSGSLVARIGGNMLKMIPGVGSILGGVSMSIMSGASTYAVGQVAVNHFERRGTFNDLDIEQAKTEFKDAYEEGKAFAKTAKTEQPAVTPDDADPMASLERLGALREKGVLSEEEFAAKKAELLTRI